MGVARTSGQVYLYTHLTLALGSVYGRTGRLERAGRRASAENLVPHDGPRPRAVIRGQGPVHDDLLTLVARLVLGVHAGRRRSVR